MDWKRFWNESPHVLDREPLRQVGKTVASVPIDAALVEVLVQSVCSTICLKADDVLLDLCCGNGMVTSKLARDCALVVGVDFSVPLLETARIKFAHPRVKYKHRDVLRLSRGFLQKHKFTKVLMYEALQHFDRNGLVRVLEQLAWLPQRPILMLASVPDVRRRNAFLDSPQKKAEYILHVEAGTDRIGHWWQMSEIVLLCRRHGFDAQILRQDRRLHGAHYRVDVLCTPAGQAI